MARETCEVFFAGTICGIASYSEDLATAIAQRGHEVDIVRLHRFARPMPKEYLETLAVRRIPEDADVIHVQHEYGLYCYMESPFYKALKMNAKPIITTMHATGVAFEADDVVACNSDVVVVHNKYCQSLLRHPSVVIPHGCTIHEPMKEEEAKQKMFEAYNITFDKPVVTVFGFITPYRRYEDVIRAIGSIDNSILLIAGGWHIAGESAYVNQLKQIAQQVAPNRVYFLDYVPKALLPAVFGVTKLVISPHVLSSESGALLTALSYGKAILASNVGSFPEKGSNGTIMTYCDGLDMKKKIELMLSDEGEMHNDACPNIIRVGYEERALKYARENSWENIAKKTLKLYNATI